MGFDPGFERPTCLATLKSSDRTKQSVGRWQYIYIYTHTHTLFNFFCCVTAIYFYGLISSFILNIRLILNKMKLKTNYCHSSCYIWIYIPILNVTFIMG